MVQIQWSIEGEKQLSRRLQGLSTAGKNLRKPFSDSAKMLKNTFAREVFSTQGGYIDEKWKKLRPSTIARKGSAQILVDTGAMKSNFRTQVGSDSAVVYNPTDYFKYHQSNKPRYKLPRRVMMKLTEDLKQRIVKIFQAFLASSIK